MNVLVIGGTGVISTEIVNRLNHLNYGVTVFNRGLRKARYDARPEVIKGDKKDAAAFKALLAGRTFDAVIDMISYNPDDAALTLDALSQSGAHFVFTSTVAAYKRPARHVPFRETDELFSDDSVSPYGYHKGRMEAYLRSRMADFPLTIIRPSLTFGLGSKNVGVMRNNYGIVERIRQGKPIVVFGDGTNPWAWTWAGDLAKAYAAVLCRGVCYGQIYHATSDDVHIWDDLYTEFGRRVGASPRLIHISTEMLMAAAPEVFGHVAQEKRYCGVFCNDKIRAAAPEFVCGYRLSDIVDALCTWYEDDAEARVVDPERDALEDALAEGYGRCMHIFGRSSSASS
ncbi:MAG: NAD-dependent epimerase/dehydratase family protein [Treponema sp.]|jgi:nucleoside-diphosphate-sugar epimerase|nr:NAD-dependent epimerase/dehydratase family protein [Treponema sp.]